LQNIKQHIGFKIATLTLMLALLAPTAAKFIHIFNHHKHEICRGEYQAHLHTSHLDCTFHKFKLTTPFTVPIFSVDFFTPEHNQECVIAQYLFLSEYQQLHFSLRGPPQFNLI
jgi:hypothetical protein